MVPALGRAAATDAHATAPPDRRPAQSVPQGPSAQPQASFNLAGLPLDLRGEVAQRLAPRSAAALAQTSRDMRAAFGDAATAARLGHAAHTADLPGTERLLTARTGIASLPAALRTAPAAAVARRLGALALQVQDLPEPARLATFDNILRLADQMAGAASAVPLPGLAAALPALPEPHRHAGFVALQTRATRMPDADRAVLDMQLTKAIPALPMAHRAAAFQAMLTAAAHHAGQARRGLSQALRHQLPHLPAADRLTAFRALVERSRGPEAQHGWEAHHLVHYVADVPIDSRHDALGALALRLSALPEDEQIRLPAALPLARIIQTLPPAHRDDAARRIAHVLQPLGRLHGWLLKRPDNEVPLALKHALRPSTATAAHGTRNPAAPGTHR